jgi:hypothetical protein
LGICMVVPLLGCVLGILTLGWSPSFEATFWPALVAGGTAFVTGTGFHATLSAYQARKSS